MSCCRRASTLREYLLRRRQVVGHGLAHLIAHTQAQHREHRAEHERDGEERRHQRARDAAAARSLSGLQHRQREIDLRSPRRRES